MSPESDPTHDRDAGRRARRTDAARNRAALVATARRLFEVRGIDVALDEIAKSAGLANATLYRHFPTRCQLAAAVFIDTLREVVDAAERALADPDPWRGFTGHLRSLGQLQAGNRALADLLTATLTGVPELERLRDRAFRDTVTLINRAKASGDLRHDFRHQDVVLILMANAGLIERTADSAPTAWRRHLSHLIDGLRATAASPAPPAPGRRQLVTAMDALADRHGFIPQDSDGQHDR